MIPRSPKRKARQKCLRDIVTSGRCHFLAWLALGLELKEYSGAGSLSRAE